MFFQRRFPATGQATPTIYLVRPPRTILHLFHSILLYLSCTWPVGGIRTQLLFCTKWSSLQWKRDMVPHGCPFKAINTRFPAFLSNEKKTYEVPFIRRPFKCEKRWSDLAMEGRNLWEIKRCALQCPLHHTFLRASRDKQSRGAAKYFDSLHGFNSALWVSVTL